MTASRHGPDILLIPRIETEHLTLNAPRVSDFDEYAPIVMSENAEGHGLAFEAGSAMRDWAFADTKLRALVSYIDPADERAISRAVRLGGRQVAGSASVVTYRYAAGET